MRAGRRGSRPRCYHRPCPKAGPETGRREPIARRDHRSARAPRCRHGAPEPHPRDRRADGGGRRADHVGRHHRRRQDASPDRHSRSRALVRSADRDDRDPQRDAEHDRPAHRAGRVVDTAVVGGAVVGRDPGADQRAIRPAGSERGAVRAAARGPRAVGRARWTRSDARHRPSAADARPDRASDRASDCPADRASDAAAHSAAPARFGQGPPPPAAVPGRWGRPARPPQGHIAAVEAVLVRFHQGQGQRLERSGSRPSADLERGRRGDPAAGGGRRAAASSTKPGAARRLARLNPAPGFGSMLDRGRGRTRGAKRAVPGGSRRPAGRSPARVNARSPLRRTQLIMNSGLAGCITHPTYRAGPDRPDGQERCRARLRWADAEARLPNVRTPDLHRRADGVAVRRRAALSALWCVPGR